MIAVSGAAMAVIRGRGGGNWGLAGGHSGDIAGDEGTECFIAGLRGDSGVHRGR